MPLRARLPLLLAAAACGAAPTTVTIAPGVDMPYITLGGLSDKGKTSDYNAWVSLGGRGLDTALTYGTAGRVGDAVRAANVSRDQLFVTSKVPCCPLKPSSYLPLAAYCRSHPLQSTDKMAEKDLKDLGLDYVDLLLLHWPCNTMDQTVKAYKQLEPLVAAGKARAIGISNFGADAVAAITAAAAVPPAVNQCGFSIGNHNSPTYGSDAATLAACRAHNITYMAYSPLGGLSGVNVLGDPDVVAVAQAHGVSTAQVALRWVTQQGVGAVTSGTDPDYLKEDLDIFRFTLSDEEMATLSGIGGAQH